jgi:hypothetical protein
MQAFIAVSLATSNVGPVPIPEACVIGHHDFTFISFACNPVMNMQENSIANATSLFMKPPLRKWKLIAAHSCTAAKVGQYIARLGCCLVALDSAVIAHAANAEDRAALEDGGVSIEVQRLHDRVSFCVSADQHHKVSSEFGVEFSLEKGSASAWKERLPKVITGPGYYFDLPARFDLRTRANAEGQSIHVALGACSKEADMCDKLEFVTTVPAEIEQAPMRCGK